MKIEAWPSETTEAMFTLRKRDGRPQAHGLCAGGRRWAHQLPMAWIQSLGLSGCAQNCYLKFPLNENELHPGRKRHFPQTQQECVLGAVALKSPNKPRLLAFSRKAHCRQLLAPGTVVVALHQVPGMGCPLATGREAWWASSGGLRGPSCAAWAADWGCRRLWAPGRG